MQTFVSSKVLRLQQWPFFDTLPLMKWQMTFKEWPINLSKKPSSSLMYASYSSSTPLIQLIQTQIASITPNSITPFLSDFEVSEYAFVGDIQQVSSNAFPFIYYFLTTHSLQLIPFDGDLNMQTNPYITITGNVSKFNIEDHTFTMTPTQYIILTHTTSPFPIHAHFVDSGSKKRWGADGPKVAVGSTVTIGGSFQRVVREHSIDRPLDFAQVEVFNITYLGSRSNLTTSPTRMSSSSSCVLLLKQNTNLNYLNRRRKSPISKTMELGRSPQTNPFLPRALNFSRQKKTNYF